MIKKQKVLHVGLGVFGKRWCTEFLASNIADGTVDVAGIVDIDTDALAYGQKMLGLPDNRCYTNAAQAFAETDADWCSVVVQPRDHEGIIDLALARGMDILCEKPIADEWEACLRIADKVRRAGVKMAVTMSHRFDQDKTTLRQLIRSGRLGRINTISCRFAADMRQYMGWSAAFRHRMQHPLLLEGAVHHLDFMADFADSPCASVYAQTWKPDWAAYEGDTDAIVTLVFENGVRAVYEGSVSNAVGLNTFYKEYVRVEGEFATAILSHREIELIAREDKWKQEHREGQGERIPLLERDKWINHWLIEQFCRWREGGPAMDTEVSRQLGSTAILFGAIESQRTGRAVRLSDLLHK